MTESSAPLPTSAAGPSSPADTLDGRTLGLFEATRLGVGAIVGGGILALAGVAFAATGPSAVLAFTANGLIALATALTFAEMATAFPESGGTYTFAKKVLSVEAAFGVGWVVWFASIVAAVLYALGFAAFAQLMVRETLLAAGVAPPAWWEGHAVESALALLSVGFYAWSLRRTV
ncbi:MAG: amino acid permease, partial [Acidobacteriota bacterium]